MTYKLKRQLKKLGNKQFTEDIKKYIKSSHEFYEKRVPEMKVLAKRLHDEHSLKQFYKITMSRGRNGLEAKVVSKRIFKIINATKPKTRYVITQNKFMNFILPGLLPDRLLDKIMGKQLKLIK